MCVSGKHAAAIATPDVKDELKRATQAAWDAGVVGVPTVRIGADVYYGDDRLEEAAAAMRPPQPAATA